jgi:hypothetical protein
MKGRANGSPFCILQFINFFTLQSYFELICTPQSCLKIRLYIRNGLSSLNQRAMNGCFNEKTHIFKTTKPTIGKEKFSSNKDSCLFLEIQNLMVYLYLVIQDSATWYSTHTCSTLLRFNCKNGVLIQNFYFS